MKKILALVYTLFLAGCSVFGIQSEDSPVYGLMETHDNIEIRNYRSYLVALTEDSGDYDTATKQSFYRLFDYISGKNQSQQKIAMTAPVTQQAKPEKIEMTAPVFQDKKGQSWTMAFVLPANYDLESAPKPTDTKITIRETPAKMVAVLSFTGFINESNIIEKKAELLTWLKQHNLKPVSEPRSAGYNPPWTIPFLRQNEIHVDIE